MTERERIEQITIKCNDKIAEYNQKMIYEILNSKLTKEEKISFLSSYDLLSKDRWIVELEIPGYDEWLSNYYNRYETVYLINYFDEQLRDLINEYPIQEEFEKDYNITIEEIKEIVYSYILSEMVDRFTYDW